MRIEIDVKLHYLLGNDPMVLLALEAARTDGQDVVSGQLQIENAVTHQIEGEAGLGQRTWARVAGENLSLSYQALVDVTRHATPLENIPATPVHELSSQTLTFLRPSRFCQSDLFTSFADQRFGALNGGQKIAAIRDWVHSEMSYVPASSNAETTVLDTFAARQGVCRDYAHMVCALARAANIPARYVSAYGINVDPPDFHAVAQVWLDGNWHIVDATGMCDVDQLALIAAGRDAFDVPFMETQTWATLISQDIKVTKR